MVRLNFRLELVKRLVRRCRVLEEGPIITKEEVIEELVCDVKVLMLDMSSSTSKHVTGWKGDDYVHWWRCSPGRMSCSLQSKCERQKY